MRRHPSLASGVSAILVPRGASAVNDVLEMARSEESVRERLWDALNAAVNEHRSSVTLQLKESKACQPDVMGLQAAFDLILIETIGFDKYNTGSTGTPELDALRRLLHEVKQKSKHAEPYNIYVEIYTLAETLLGSGEGGSRRSSDKILSLIHI